MKQILILSFFLPSFVFGQTKLDDLKTNNGLAYEVGKTVPFSGKAYSYFPNGDIQSSMEYKNGLMNGEIKSWYKKDVLQVEGFVENRIKTGVWKMYYENGKLKKQTNFKNNIENGEEIFWFENSKFEKKGNYIDGKLNGKYEWFYENGQKKQEGHFVNGKEDGTWSDWFENGKQKMIGQFLNSEKSGVWTWYDENGNGSISKTYKNGMVEKGEDNLDSYIEKMGIYISKKDFKNALKNVELAENTITDKTERNPVFMGLQVYHSKCYSFFSHNKQAEIVLLKTIGLNENQIQIIQNSHKEKLPEKVKTIIKELTTKDKSKFLISNHIALGLCYNILGDTISLQKEQQLGMEKGGNNDWIINISLALYRLLGDRVNNAYYLEEINNQIKKDGKNEELELAKAHYLIANEDLENAEIIIDKYLKVNNRNLSALTLKVDLEMVKGNLANMKLYESKVLAIDPNALTQKPE